MNIYHREFLLFLNQWVDALPSLSLPEICPSPKNSAIISVDVINGFCSEGPLSSPRVQKIVNPITRLFTTSWEYGIKNIVLTQDTHEPDAVEFGSFPPHCVRGTSEAATVPAFKELPFFKNMVVLEKNSIHSGINTGLMQWMDEHLNVSDYLVVGDCTDLCVYQLAMHLRLDANARQQSRRVIIPAECVDTYDMSVSAAANLGAMPHDAELLHAIFLYHMALNGVLIVKSIH
jgi:nicotinamidase-related amidase